MHKIPLRRVAFAAALVLLALVPTAGLAKTTKKAKPKHDVSVMSRNLYLGADIITLATATSKQDQAARASALYGDVKKTNFPKRAKALAAEVKKAKPDLIGLQEVARYYKGPLADPAKKGAKTPVYDWLKILQKQLKARGLKYTVVSQQTEINVETALKEGYDLRLTLGNAVLVRADKKRHVKIVKGVHGNFSKKSQLVVPLQDQTLTLSRGYAGGYFTTRGKKFLFLDPHAEAYGAAIAKAQFQQLVKGPASSRKLPVIIAGDFNSDPSEKPPGGYATVLNAGFKDTGKRHATCCQNALVNNKKSELKTWIDHIVVRPAAKVLKTYVFGNKASDKIGGLWPSDHAGVVAYLRLK
jgi:endonuclease/exonuclease/phosphatase family metal-dependent hydrolase